MTNYSAMDKSYFFAVDLGATSGRTILGKIESDSIELEVINRFPNHIIENGGHCYWDIFELYRNIIEGLKLVAQRKEVKLSSIGVDTWGVDFVCLGEDGNLIRMPYSYRDTFTNGAPERFFERMSRTEVYQRTGIQVMNINSLYKLDTMRANNDSAFKAAKHFLFMPDAISYLLTGEKVTEYTIASTSQLINAKTRKFDPELLKALGLTEENFGRFVHPGEKVGTLSEEVQRLTGLPAVPVVAVGGHDTASAVAAVPALNHNFAYLSSGTWSLMGIEAKEPMINKAIEELNYTNEGGVEGTIRFLKNICGMWLLERCRALWGETSYPELIAAAAASAPFRSFINPDDPVFANTSNMVETIQKYCEAHGQPVPQSQGEIVRCIFESLALRYRQVYEDLNTLFPNTIEVLHVIGGGSQNALLNQWIANALGIPVVAGPTEATAIGNISIQAIAQGYMKNVQEARTILNKTLQIKKFAPAEVDAWNDAFQRFDAMCKA